MSPEIKRSARSSQAGFSLIEIVVAIVVVSISLAGTMLVVDTTTRTSAHPMLERQAIAIGEAYLEEILQKSYLDPDDGTVCPSPEASRDLFDNLCDYDGFSQMGARDQFGGAITGLENYRIQIEVDGSATLGSFSGANQVLRVDATITDPLGRAVRLTGYRTSA